MAEAHTQPVALTPSTYARLAEYAKKHQWTLSAAACYLIEDGIDGEERRADWADRPGSGQTTMRSLNSFAKNPDSPLAV